MGRDGYIRGHEVHDVMMPIHSVPLPPLAAIAPWMIYVAAVFLGLAILVRVLGWMWIKRAKEEFKRDYPEYWKLLHPEQLEPEEDGAGKRPGQFGIFDLLVLTTVAAIACAIIRLPIHTLLKMFALVAVWLGFTIWVCGRPDAQKARSLAYKRRLAVMHAIGSILAFAPYLWLRFVERPGGWSSVSASLTVLILLGPIRAIWSAVSAVWAEFAAGRGKRAVAH